MYSFFLDMPGFAHLFIMYILYFFLITVKKRLFFFSLLKREELLLEQLQTIKVEAGTVLQNFTNYRKVRCQKFSKKAHPLGEK